MIKWIRQRILNTTIRQKLTLMISIFVLYPVLIVAFFGYFIYAQGIRSEVLHSLNQTIEQVNSLTLERFEQTKRFAMMIPYDGTLNEIYIQKKKGELSHYNLNRDITNYLYSKFYSKQEIKAVSFCYTSDSKDIFMVQSDNSYNRYVTSVHPLVLAEAQKTEEQFGYYISDDGEIYAFRKMMDRYSFEQYGLITLKIDKAFMLSDFEQRFANQSGFLLTYNGNILYEKGQIPEEERDNVLRSIKEEAVSDKTESRFRIKPYEVVTSHITLDNISFEYGVVMPTRAFMDKYYSALRLLLIMTALVTGTMLLAAIPLYKAVWSPIRELVGLMKILEEGNFGVQSKRKRNDEFKFIFDSFNAMSNEIKYLFDVAYKEELARKEAQLAALQARINPHFLYNTLEIMNWKARIAGNTELSDMIEALGTLLDAGMNRDERKVTTLREEIKLVDSYMFIMDKRFGKRLEFIREIDESLLDGTIPSLLIQPLLENAVIHGLEPHGGGKLKLSIFREERGMTISVEDNGAGISDEDLVEFEKLFMEQPSRIKNSTGIGVRNVHSRIRILYGSEYGLSLRKGADGGTVASFTIPYMV